MLFRSAIGVIAYYLGDAAAAALGRYGLLAAGGVILLSAIGFVIARQVEKRVLDEDD